MYPYKNHRLARLQAMHQWQQLANLHLPSKGAAAAMTAIESGAHLLERQLEEAELEGLGTSLPVEFDVPREALALDARIPWCDARMADLASSLGDTTSLLQFVEVG